jgi:hypothetical protein
MMPDIISKKLDIFDIWQMQTLQVPTQLEFSHSHAVALGNVVLSGLTLQAGKSLVRFPMRSPDFPIDLILPTAIVPCGRLSL